MFFISGNTLSISVTFVVVAERLSQVLMLSTKEDLRRGIKMFFFKICGDFFLMTICIRI